MNRDEQLKELFKRRWEMTVEERRAELVELGVIQEEKSEAYKEGYNRAIDDMKSEWDKRFKNLIQWCKEGRLMGLRQADFIFEEIAVQLKDGGKDGR